LGKEHGKIEKFSSDGTALSSSFYERILDILQRLNELPIDLRVLSETLIGMTVSKFKSCPDDKVMSAAKSLIKKWKKTAKQSGVSSNKAAKRPSIGVKRSNSVSSISSATNTPSNDKWKELPQLRQNACRKFLDILSSDAPDPDAVVPKVTEIDLAIQALSKGDRAAYAEKFRSLMFNLKKNKALRMRLWSNLDGKTLVRLSPDEMATSEKVKARQEIKQKISDSRRLDWEQANEDKINEMCGIKGDLLKATLFTCGRCKSTKTTSTQKQTRSADEPMTVFVFCKNCGNRWKC
jgi:transcription elongation factor S-II